LKGCSKANNVRVFNYLIKMNADVSSVDAKGSHGAMQAAGAANSTIWEQFFSRHKEFRDMGLDWNHVNKDERNVSGICCNKTGPKTVYKDCWDLYNIGILTCIQEPKSVSSSSANRRTTPGNEPGTSSYVRDQKIGKRSAIDGARTGWYANAWQASSYGGGGGGQMVVCWRCQGSGHQAWACPSYWSSYH